MMNRGFLAAAALFLAGLSFLPASLAAEEIAWLENVDEAFAEAKRTDKILMVDVYTEWCVWCKKLDREVYTDPRVAALSAAFVNLKINPEVGEKNAEFAAKYQVSGFPTILFMEPDGTILYRIPGFVDAAAFAGKMKTASDNRSKLKTYRAEAASGDYRNAADYIPLLAESGRGSAAADVFDKAVQASALSPERRGGAALGVSKALLDEEEFERALSYIEVAEKFASNPDDGYAAKYYRAVSIFYVSGRTEALKYLEERLAAEKTPEIWTKRYAFLRDQIVKTK